MLFSRVAILCLLLPLREAFVIRKSSHCCYTCFLNLLRITGSWDEANSLARSVIAKMTVNEKLNVVIGTGQRNAQSKCVLGKDAFPLTGYLQDVVWGILQPSHVWASLQFVYKTDLLAYVQ